MQGEGKGTGEPGRRESSGFFEEIAGVLGRAAGRTKESLVRLGEKGAVRLALTRMRHERDRLLRELGEVSCGALRSAEAVLRADDPRAKEIIEGLDRLERRVERLEAASPGAEKGPDVPEAPRSG